MRLLKLDSSDKITLTRNFRDDEVPPYTILSHTWGREDEEVSFNDVNSERGKTKSGYDKVRFCGQQSRRDGFEYFWVDTCCINKGDLAELQEAINSMFRWYQEAQKCYVYLADVSSHKRDVHGETQDAWESAMRKSRWFTRGWTLQELVAPTVVEFFSRDEQLLGSRDALGPLLQDITTIPLAALQGSTLSQFTVHERMRWAEGRSTTKPEDRWYCLLGIFEVSMPLVYGEGDEKALVRLKKEIGRLYKSQLDDIGSSISRYSSFAASSHALEQSTSDEVKLRKQLMESLAFEQMDSRRATIKTAYTTTCAWLLRHPLYLDWTDPDKFEQHHGFFWLKGKPGAGKSTLIKFAYADVKRRKPRGEILLSFFFNARGDMFQKSTLGMYRSLLFQLLQASIDLQEVLDDPELQPQSAWTLELLHELFTIAIRKLGRQRVKIFIDALDECDEHDVQDMIFFFENLREEYPENLHIFFASRHYPTIFIRNGIQLILEHESGHSKDLIHFVKSNLRIKPGKVLEEVEKRIAERANGVFMWAVLVVDILNNEVRRGRIFNVSKRLEEIPPKLSDLFKDILRRDGTDMDQLLLCLQWILYARRPLTPDEFYHAMMVGPASSSGDIIERDPESETDEDIINFVHDCSKGLAELTNPAKPIKSLLVVQFIHESVRDFLLKDGGLYELWPHLKPNAEALSHDELKQCCHKYWNVDLKDPGADYDIQKHKANTRLAENVRASLCTRFPFLQYSTEEYLYHADQAAKSVTQEEILGLGREHFQSMTSSGIKWIYRFNLLQRHEACRLLPLPMNLFSIFAAFNLPRLMKIYYERAHQPYGIGWTYQDAFLVALQHKAWDALRTMLEQSVRSEFDLDKLLETMKQDCSRMGRAVKARSHPTPLHWALDNENEPLAYVLAELWRSSYAERDHWGRNPLHIAAKLGYNRIVDQILAHEDAVLDVDTYGRTALSYAAEKGSEAVVKSLLECPNIEDAFDGECSALEQAVAEGHTGTVSLLLAYSADAETHDDARVGLYSAEQIAAAFTNAVQINRCTLARTLLNYVAYTEDTETYFSTAMSHAVLMRRPNVLKMVLEKVPKWDLINSDGRYALQEAFNEVSRHYARGSLNAWKWKLDRKLIRLLLEHGTKMENREAAFLLLQAAKEGSTDLIRLILERGHQVDPTDNMGRTPLLWAAKMGHTEAVQVLLEFKAKIEAQEARLMTPLHLASTSSHPDTVRVLLAHGADINARHEDSMTALLSAIETLEDAENEKPEGAETEVTEGVENENQLDTIKLLLDHGADVEAATDSGYTSLYLAVQNQNAGVTRLLLGRGASIQLSETQSNYPLLCVATRNGCIEIMTLLLDHGVDINCRRQNGATPLMEAVSKGHDPAARLLLDRGADVHIADDSGDTAVSWLRRSQLKPADFPELV